MEKSPENQQEVNLFTSIDKLAQEALKEGHSLDQYQASLKNLDQRGRIELIIGCMFAGKSTEMLRRVRKHEIAGKRILTVKFSADNRYLENGMIVTHEGQKRAATEVVTLATLGDIWKDYDCIGIDEGQFFPDIVEFSETAANNGKILIISSLGGTFLRGPFTRILEIIPKCEKIKKLAAICRVCKQSASFTFRTASKTDQSMIGGAEKYMPVCRECHYVQTKLNQDCVFDGDAEITNPDVETSQKLQPETDEVKREGSIQTTPSPVTQTGSTGSGGTVSPKNHSLLDEDDAKLEQSPMLIKFASQQQSNSDQKLTTKDGITLINN